jgi:HprK-related kinase B
MSPEKNVEYVLRQFAAGHHVSVQFGECRIDLSANDPQIVDILKDYFNHFKTGFLTVENDQSQIDITVLDTPPQNFDLDFTVKAPDFGKTKIKEEYVDVDGLRIVRKRLTGMIFAFGNGKNIAFGPSLKNMNQVVNFINNRYIEWKLCKGCLLGHAAAVIKKGRGLALAGMSGAGKSTLALHVMCRDAGFVSNDRLMIQKAPDSENELRMYGVAKLPRINPGTALNNPLLENVIPEKEQERFRELPRKHLWHLEHKYDVYLDDCFGENCFFPEAPMNGLVILNWNMEGDKTMIRKVDPGRRRDLLPAFIKPPGLFFHADDGCKMPEPSERNYIDYLNRCEVVEISGKIDFDLAVDACVSFLDTGAFPVVN